MPVNDVKIEISVVHGKAAMPINQLLRMGRGAVIELDSSGHDHALHFATSRLIARGEVMVVGDHVAIPITDTVG